MCAGRKPLSDDSDDRCVDACERGREFDPVAAAETAAVFDSLVFPRDSKQVDGIEVPKSDITEPCLDRVGDQGGILLL